MRRIGLIAALAGAFAGGGAARAEPVTVRDAFDRSVTVPEPPQRIVTIFAFCCLMLRLKTPDGWLLRASTSER